MSKDIKKALEHCINNECVGCPNNEELGSGEIVCRARLLPEILEYISDLQHRLEVADRATKLACNELRALNYRTFDNADIDFEQQFKEQAEKKLKGEKNDK